MRYLLIFAVIFCLFMAAAFLTFFIIYLNSGESIMDNFFGDYEVVKQESFEVSSFTELTFAMVHEAVEIEITDGDRVVVTQYSKSALAADKLFTAQTVGSRLEVTSPYKKRINLFFTTWAQRYVIQIPRSFNGSLKASSTSGSVALNGDGTWESLTLESTSGSVRQNGTINADSLTLKSTSGSVHADSIEADRYTLKSTSGSVKINSLVGDGSMSSTSGSVWAGYLSGNSHELSSLSGSVTVDSFGGSGKISSTSGSVKVSISALTGDLNLKSTSGSVRATFAPSVSAFIDAGSVSGSVRSDYPITYGTNKKSGSGNVGDNPSYFVSMHTTSGSVHINRG